MKQSGTLIISLDFELHWGVFGSVTDISPYMRNLFNTPKAINGILEVFEKRKISATWATVGFLFAESSDMLKDFEPLIKPVYPDIKSNPYLLNTGHNEVDDPIHFAPSIISKIRSVPGQEIATHTFSHFLCRAEGTTIEAFLSDLQSAVEIAERYEIKIDCIVFPRNQLIQELIDILPQKGISVYRGAEKGWMYTGIKNLNGKKPTKTRQSLNRLGRVLDTYIPLSGSNTWSKDELITQPGQPINVPASRFLRPFNPKLKYLEWLKFRRIKKQIELAARNGKMIHLRWHPHNFGSYINENIRFLNIVLDYFEYCKSEYDMRSMTMHEYSEILYENQLKR